LKGGIRVGMHRVPLVPKLQLGNAYRRSWKLKVKKNPPCIPPFLKGGIRVGMHRVLLVPKLQLGNAYRRSWKLKVDS